MASFFPLSQIIFQYDKVELANHWLKAYEAGTTTPRSLYTDAAGSVAAAKIELDTEGFPITAGNARVTPYIGAGDFDLWLFPTEADADNNDTTSAIQLADDRNGKSLQSDGPTNFETLQDLGSGSGFIVNEIYSVQGYSTPGDGGAALRKCIDDDATGGSPGFDSDGVYRVDNGDGTFSELEIVSDFDALAMGGDPDAVLGAVANGKRCISGSLVLTSNVSKDIADGVDAVCHLDSISGQYKLSFNGTLGSTELADNISRFETEITVADGGAFTVGEYVRIAGTVGHEDYTPSRYTSMEQVCIVTAIDGNVVTVDTPIDYVLTSVTMTAMRSCSLDICVGSSDSSEIGVFNVPRLCAKIKQSVGNVGEDSGQKYLHASAIHTIECYTSLENAKFINGIRLDNITHGTSFLTSTHGGSVNDCKTFRANGLRNMTCVIIGVSSMWKDVDVQGARACEFHIISTGSGQYFFENNITTSNRLESVVFLECDRINAQCNISEANDQAFEFLSCTDSKVSGYIAQSSRTTNSEGCVVFKQASKNLILDAVVRANTSIGVKLENLNGMTNATISSTSDIYSESNIPVVSRDSTGPGGVGAYNNGHRISGRIHRGNAGVLVELRQGNDDTIVDIDADMTNATTAVQVSCDKANVSVSGYNTDTNKELVNIGDTATNFQGGQIAGDTPDVHVEYNGNSRDTFTLTQCGQLAGAVKFAGSGAGTGTVFTVKGNDYYANTVPVYGNFSAGDFYRRQAVNETGDTVAFGGKNVKTVELGRQYDG